MVPRQLGRVLVPVRQLRLRRAVLEVLGAHVVGVAERRTVADDEGAGAIGQEHPFVRVEGDRVGAFDPMEPLSSSVGEMEEAAVRGIDVHPQILRLGHVGHRVHRVDRSGVRGTGGRHDEERSVSGAAVLGHHRLERLGVHPKLRIDGHESHRATRHPGDRGGLRHGRVRLLAHVVRSVAEVFELHVTCGDDRREVRDRAAGREDAARLVRVAEEVAEPPDHVLLDLDQPRRDLPEVREAVHGHREELPERRRVQTATGDVGQIARATGLVGPRSRVAELGEDLVERPALLRGRCLQREGRLEGAVDVAGRSLGQTVDEVDHVVDRHLPHRPHLLGRGIEGAGHAVLRSVASIVSRSRRDESVTSSTAASNASTCRDDGVPKPLTLRTNCRAASRISSSLAYP